MGAAGQEVGRVKVEVGVLPSQLPHLPSCPVSIPFSFQPQWGSPVEYGDTIHKPSTTKGTWDGAHPWSVPMEFSVLGRQEHCPSRPPKWAWRAH